MKVLFISSWYPTPLNPNYGIFVKEHARAIKTSTADLRVLAIVIQRSDVFFKTSQREYIDESNIPTFEIIIQTKMRDIIYHLVPLQSRISFWYFKNYIEPFFSPDIIHSNVIFPAGMIGDYFSRKLKKPHIITEHWSKIEGLLHKPYLSFLAKRSYRKADRILAVSKFLKGNILRLLPNFKSDKFEVIPNVISNKVFDFKEKSSRSNEITFCAVATWTTKRNPDKKPELFIQALAEIQKHTSKKIKLTMVGDGNRVNELIYLCKSVRLDADFVGFLSKEKIAERLQKTDYFIHASTIETFGVVIVEALMTGTPVICSNVGGLPELINDSNGVLCWNNVESWVSGIEKLIQTDFNRKEISDSVKSRFSYERIGKEITSVYETL
ncbi:MAG: glycosyltransferase [Paludibacter sp.]